MLEWLKASGCRIVVIHLDLDVLDPADLFCAVGNVPNGLKLEAVQRIIDNVAQHAELVGLTVAEHMPRAAMRLRQMLQNLPLIGK